MYLPFIKEEQERNEERRPGYGATRKRGRGDDVQVSSVHK